MPNPETWSREQEADRRDEKHDRQHAARDGKPWRDWLERDQYRGGQFEDTQKRGERVGGKDVVEPMNGLSATSR